MDAPPKTHLFTTKTISELRSHVPEHLKVSNYSWTFSDEKKNFFVISVFGVAGPRRSLLRLTCNVTCGGRGLQRLSLYTSKRRPSNTSGVLSFRKRDERLNSAFYGTSMASTGT